MKKIFNPIFLFILTLFVSVGVSAQVVLAATAAWTVAYVGSRLFLSILVDFVGSGPSFCWFCPAISAMFDAMNRMATTISLHLSHVFLSIMGVGLLFLIAFKTARMLVSLQAVDIIQFLNDLFKPLGRAIVATGLLVFSLSIFNVLVSPILIMSLSLSDMIIEAGGGRGEMITAMRQVQHEAEVSGSGATIRIRGLCEDLNVVEKIKAGASLTDQKTAFTEDVRASLVCSVRTSSAGLMFGMILGSTIWALAFIDMWMGVIPNFNYILLGGLISLGHLAIFITFPFKLVDGILRMAFVCALMPLWIILWVFPATVGYTKKAWDMFISTCSIFLCLSVVIVLIMHLMQFAIPNRELLIQYLVKDQLKEAANLIPFSGVNLLLTLMLCFVGFKMLGTATSLASTFTGNMPDLGAGAAMQTVATQMAKTGGSLASTGAGMAMDKLGVSAATRDKLKWGVAGAALGVFTGGASYAAMGAYRGISKFVNRGKQESTSDGGDAESLTTTETDQYGNTTTTEYYDKDKQHKKSQTKRDTMGNEQRYDFDRSGDLTTYTETKADGSSLSHEYNDQGLVTKLTEKRVDGTGSITEYYDDGNMKSYSAWDISGAKTTTTFYEDGKTTKSETEVFANGEEKTTEFGRNGTKTKETEVHADRSSESTEYYGNGQTKKATVYNDVLGNEKRVDYDQSGVETKYTEVKHNNSRGVNLETVYDCNTDETTTTLYTQNGVALQSSTKDSSGNTEYYDAKGNKILTEDNAGKTTFTDSNNNIFTIEKNASGKETVKDSKGRDVSQQSELDRIRAEIDNVKNKMNI